LSSSETSAFEQVHPDDRFKVLEASREARSTGVGRRLDYRIRHKDGTWRVLESIASTIRDAKGEVAKLVIVNRDITERKHAEEQLEHNSFHDALTGLPNRRLFLDRLQNLFLRAERNPEHTYALLLVDVDGFKNLNDTMGARVGDLLLAEIARRLSSCLRQDDTVARGASGLQATEPVLSRLGSDEFTILLDRIAEPSDALRVAKRIQDGLAEPFLLEGREVRTSASVGIAIHSVTQERAEFAQSGIVRFTVYFHRDIIAKELVVGDFDSRPQMGFMAQHRIAHVIKMRGLGAIEKNRVFDLA